MRAETDLAAPPAAVWAALLDLPSWPRWATFHPTARGPVAVGEALTMRFTVRGRRVDGRARFTRVEPERALWWRGGLGPLLVVEHGFELAPGPGGGTRLLHEERFGGLWGPLAVWALGPGQPAKYAAVNEALAVYLGA